MSASAILKLQAAGFSTEQVTALADLIDTQAASKSDVVEAKSSLKSDLEGVEHRLELKIEHDVGAVKADVLVLKWMMGFVLAFQVAVLGKLLMLH